MNLLFRLEQRAGRILTSDNKVVINSLSFNVIPLEKTKFLSTISGKKLYAVSLCDSTFTVSPFSSKCYVPLLLIREISSFDNNRVFRCRISDDSGIIEYGINHTRPYFPSMKNFHYFSAVGKSYRFTSFDAGTLFFVDEEKKEEILKYALTELMSSNTIDEVPELFIKHFSKDSDNELIKEFLKKRGDNA